jgi:hypothetical protein
MIQPQTQRAQRSKPQNIWVLCVLWLSKLGFIAWDNAALLAAAWSPRFWPPGDADERQANAEMKAAEPFTADKRR